MPRFVLPGATGLLVRGNIDIEARALVKVPAGGGKFASVLTCGWHLEPDELLHRYRIRRPNGAEVLCPQVIRGAKKWLIVSAEGALSHYRRTGLHLGIFDTSGHAESYGQRLHLEQQAAQGRG